MPFHLFKPEIKSVLLNNAHIIKCITTVTFMKYYINIQINNTDYITNVFLKLTF